MSGAGFVKTPNALLLDPDLPGETLRAYMVLARNAIFCSSDTFEMTGEQLATLLGRSRDTADRRLRELEQRGLVLVEGNRGRARPNRITVLDPQETVFGGLHVVRASADLPQQASADLRKPASAEVPKPSNKEVEDERGQRSKRTTTLPQPVDNRGAPRPRCPVVGHEHATRTSYGECTACRSERITGPPF